MDDHHQEATESNPQDQPFDLGTLVELLSVGGEEMRSELSGQLQNDFRRIARMLESDERIELAAATHELKGLASTIGATRLAQNAQTLNSIAGSADTVVLSIMSKTVRQEIGQVLDVLQACDQS